MKDANESVGETIESLIARLGGKFKGPSSN
jgi:hypothetical protein